MAPQSATATITVDTGDSLFKLAEQHLGNGLRWRELWDLNQGRVMDDGTTFQRPELIRPGWQLVVPTDHAETVVNLAASSPAAIMPAAVEPSPKTEPVPSQLLSPETASEVGCASDDVVAPASSPVATPAPSEPTDSQPADVDDGLAPSSIAAGVFGGGVLMSLGIGALVTARRRRRLRSMSRVHQLAASEPDVAATDLVVRSGGAPNLVDRIDLALKALAGRMTASPVVFDAAAECISAHPARPVVMISYADGTIEILLDRAVEQQVPVPFAAGAFAGSTVALARYRTRRSDRVCG